MNQRIDDFRCHDARLVQVLPGREKEAVAFAIRLRREGQCDGLFVLGDGITNWAFLQDAKGFDRLEFIRVGSSFCHVNHSLLSDARSLRIGDVRCDIDFSPFSRLEQLEFEWTDGCTGLSSVKTLTDVTISGIGKAKRARIFHLPKRVRRLSIVGYGDNRIEFGCDDHFFESMSIAYARSLQEMPRLKAVHYLDLKSVGRDAFDYSTVPLSVRGLNIDSGAPICEWDFLEKMEHLEYLHVYRTKCPAVPKHLSNRLSSLSSVVMPRNAGLYGAPTA